MTGRGKRRRRPAAGPLSLSLLLGEMALASAETIARRTQLIVSGRCSPAEASRMGAEKLAAAAETAALLATPAGRGDLRRLLAPWHRRVTANAKRLRKRSP